jgi:hypothetical protein
VPQHPAETGPARQQWRARSVELRILWHRVDLTWWRSTHGQKSKRGGRRSARRSAWHAAGPAEQKESTMRFLGYTLADPSVPIPPPSPDMFAKMGAFVEEATKAGVLLATGGLGPVDEAIKVTYSGGKFTVLDGPFSEAKELVGGWALMETRDKDEAIEWTKRFLAIVGEGESTIRQVY